MVENAAGDTEERTYTKTGVTEENIVKEVQMRKIWKLQI
jgi:hypothetical protein